MRLKSWLLPLMILATCPIAASAGFMISASPNNPYSLSSGVVNVTVLIVNTDVSHASTLIGDVSVAFEITNNPANSSPPASPPVFVAPTSYTTDPTLKNPNYLFVNPAQPQSASFKIDAMTPFVDSIHTGSSGPYITFNTRMTGSDAEDSLTVSGVSIPAGGSYTLAVLAIQMPTTTNLSGASSELFDLNLDLATTRINDTGGIKIGPVNTTPLLAQLQVNLRPATVPEPATLPMLVVSMSLVGVAIRWRRCKGR